LKNTGYYFFSPDYLLVKVDTTAGDNQVDLFVTVKKDIPEKATWQYHINNIYINPAFRLTDSSRRRSRQSSSDTLNYEDRYYIVGRTGRYKPSIFKIPMQFSPRERYNRDDEVATVSKLVNMGTFKFVKYEFTDIYTYPEPRLDVLYELTPYSKKSLQVEIGAVTKNDSRAGSQINISWRNRN